MRYTNRLARANHQALAPKFNYEDSEGSLPGYLDQSEVSSCDSALTGSSLAGSSINNAAPSALRKGKYSRYPYPRSDLDSDGNNSLGSSMKSYHSYSQGHYYGQYTDTYPGDNYKVGRDKHINGAEKILPQSIANESKSYRSAVTPYTEDRPLPSHVMLPNGATIGATGYILSRHTRLSILFKKSWKELIWVHVKPTTIIFFESRSDCNRWMRKPSLSPDAKKKLIKHSIDFDAMGSLIENQNCKSNATHSTKVMTYSMTDVRSKKLDVDGSYSHRFNVDRLKNSGSNVEMVFCSTQVVEVKQLRKTIRKCLKKVTTALSQKNLSDQSNGKAQVEYDDNDSSVNNGSDISGRLSASSLSLDSRKMKKINAVVRRRKSRRHRS